MRHLRWPVLGSLGLSAAIGSELFDCTNDDEWMDFRRLVEANAAAGYPTDVDLVVKAQGLVQLQGNAIEVDQEAAYGAAKGMRDFQRSCNAPPSAPTPSPFCLYGVVTALWVVARHSHPDRRNLLQHASFLLGSTLNHVLDFTESSAWPITLADVLANIDAADGDQDFLLPGDVSSRYGMPLRPSPEEALAAVHVAESFDHETIRIEVWEVGVHASLSAEPIHMFAQILSGTQMKYRNLIKDQYPVWMPNRCETLYWHPKLECYEPDDEISQLFQRRIPHSATSKDPVTDIDGLAEEFEIAASARLNYVDFMLCTVAYLCLMLKDLDLPVLGYFGHPLLFMVPDDQDVREKYWERFAAMASKSSVEFAVSDPFLQMQFEYQLGKPTLPIIRTHALYTGTTHFPTRAAEVLVLDRPHEAILMCAIQRLMGGTPIDWPLADGRLSEASSSEYPFRFVTRAMTDRKFSTFAQFRAVVLWPYDMDLITFYEFYGMNMPIFMPSQLSKYLFHQDHQSYNYRWGERDDPGDYSIWATEEWSPFQELSPGAAHRIVGFSDYFRFPAVQYFDSIPHLLRQLPSLDFFEVVQAMARFNRDSMAESARTWRLLLRRATGFEAEFF